MSTNAKVVAIVCAVFGVAFVLIAVSQSDWTTGAFALMCFLVALTCVPGWHVAATSRLIGAVVFAGCIWVLFSEFVSSSPGPIWALVKSIAALTFVVIPAGYAMLLGFHPRQPEDARRDAERFAEERANVHREIVERFAQRTSGIQSGSGTVEQRPGKVSLPPDGLEQADAIIYELLPSDYSRCRLEITVSEGPCFVKAGKHRQLDLDDYSLDEIAEYLSEALETIDAVVYGHVKEVEWVRRGRVVGAETRIITGPSVMGVGCWFGLLSPFWRGIEKREVVYKPYVEEPCPSE